MLRLAYRCTVGVIRRKNLDQPDEIRTFPRMVGHLAQIGSLAIGRATLEPGWRWSTDVGPASGGSSCPVHHMQLLLAGRFAVRMDDGESAEMVPNDVFDVPPGHDAWVVGAEPVVLVDFYGNAGEVGLPSEHQRAVTTILMSDSLPRGRALRSSHGHARPLGHHRGRVHCLQREGRAGSRSAEAAHRRYDLGRESLHLFRIGVPRPIDEGVDPQLSAPRRQRLHPVPYRTDERAVPHLAVGDDAADVSTGAVVRATVSMSASHHR
jgi:hypothetical protein